MRDDIDLAASALERSMGGDSRNKLIVMGPAPMPHEMDTRSYEAILGRSPPRRHELWKIDPACHGRSHEDVAYNGMLCDISVSYTLMEAWEDDDVETQYFKMCRKLAKCQGRFEAWPAPFFLGRPSFWDALRMTWTLFSMHETSIIGL